jgi:hypothetical protein
LDLDDFDENEEFDTYVHNDLDFGLTQKKSKDAYQEFERYPSGEEDLLMSKYSYGRLDSCIADMTFHPEKEMLISILETIHNKAATCHEVSVLGTANWDYMKQNSLNLRKQKSNPRCRMVQIEEFFEDDKGSCLGFDRELDRTAGQLLRTFAGETRALCDTFKFIVREKIT